MRLRWVNPARAGMIHSAHCAGTTGARKPRASGDDPVRVVVLAALVS